MTTSPEATIQAVATKRKKLFESVCRHAGDVMKLLPGGFVDLHDIALQTQTYINVEEPWLGGLVDGRSTIRTGCTYSEHQNSSNRHQVPRNTPSVYQVRRTRNHIRRAPEQDMLQENDSQKPLPRTRSRLFLHWQSSDEFPTHSRKAWCVCSFWNG